MNHKPHCPVPVISYNGNLIVAAAQKYPAVIARLPANYIPETITALGKLPGDISGQSVAKGETGNLTVAQQDNLDSLLICMGQARKTAKLAFPGQSVKLHQEFQIGLHESHELSAELGRADIILASVQTAANLPAMNSRVGRMQILRLLRRCAGRSRPAPRRRPRDKAKRRKRLA